VSHTCRFCYSHGLVAWWPTAETDQCSEKHSQFATTFPIYIKERKINRTPIPAPQSPVQDGDDDELNDDLDTDDVTPVGDEFETSVEETWVRVNDKAPIWMR
jgi:heat shock protein beta